MAGNREALSCDSDGDRVMWSRGKCRYRVVGCTQGCIWKRKISSCSWNDCIEHSLVWLEADSLTASGSNSFRMKKCTCMDVFLAI